MHDTATKQPPLIERLRKTKSTAKTRFLAKWPEIRQALDEGFTAKAIHSELAKDGLEISYRRFAELVKEMAPSDPPTTPPSPNPNTAPATHNDAPLKAESVTIKRYIHNPIPDPNELF